MASDALARTTLGLVEHLFSRGIELAEFEHELACIDAVLVDRMADKLLEGVDWDAWRVLQLSELC
jgi:hypothetical protein